jgi:hypothetical protein
MSRADRRYALDHLGLPQSFHPSRATSLKLAETLDADSIIVGSYVTDGAGIVAEAQLVDVPYLRMSNAVTARGEMRSLIAVFDSLAWKLTRQLDPGFKDSEATFLAADSGLRLDAFEQYIRGITEPDQPERLRHLNRSRSARSSRRLGWRWAARSMPASSTSRRQRPSPRWGATTPTLLRLASTVAYRCSSPAATPVPKRPLPAWPACCRSPRF